MSRNKIRLMAVMLAAGAARSSAQVVAPAEIRDLNLRELQQKHLPDLDKIGAGIARHQFPYHFYLSRKLDLSEEQQRGADQRSIRFDTFHNQTVLEITGNYYASYSAGLMDTPERARRTLMDVVAPILQAAVPPMQDEAAIQGFAVEVSHHVRRQMLGVTVEGVEHIAFLLPRRAARTFLSATTPGEQEAALLQGALYVNASPAPGWEDQAQAWTETPAVPASSGPAAAVAATHVPPAAVAQPSSAPTAETLRQKQASYQPVLDSLVRDLDKDAHFVAYAKPTFIAFRDGAYLQLSVSTTLEEAQPGSRYRAAALAFDEHIAHLIRPVLTRLKDRSGLDGVDFSTTVRAAGENASALAIEFVFPLPALVCYERYDCTGQQLIDQGFILINGERISLNLQSAEATR
jgi:hypothetical protein